MLKNIYIILFIFCIISCQTEKDNKNIVTIDIDESYLLQSQAYLPELDSALTQNKKFGITPRQIYQIPYTPAYACENEIYNEIASSDIDKEYIRAQGLLFQDTLNDIFSTHIPDDSYYFKEELLPNTKIITKTENDSFIVWNSHKQVDKFMRNWRKQVGYGFVNITYPIFNKSKTKAVLHEYLFNSDWACGTGKTRLLYFTKKDTNWTLTKKINY